MSQDERLKRENWTDFPKYPYSIFHEDFVHNHLCHLKFKTQTAKNSADIRIAAKKRESGTEVGHETKILWQLCNDKALLMRFKSNGYFKLHYDNGLIERRNLKFNLYGSFNGCRDLENLNLRAGVHVIGKQFQLDTRGKFEWGKSQISKGTLYSRFILNKGSFKLGFISAYEMYGQHPHLLLKNNFMWGYQPDSKTSFFFRLQNKNYRRDYSELSNLTSLFDIAYFDIVSSYNDTFKYGMELACSLKQKKMDQLVAVAEYHLQSWDQVLKAKINQKLHTSLMWRFKTGFFGDKAYHSLGFHTKGWQWQQKKDQFLFGFQTDFQI